MANQKISGAIGIEVVVQPGQRTIYFPDVALLRNKRIKHIDIVDDIPKGKSGISTGSLYGTVNLRTLGTQSDFVEKLDLEQLKTSIHRGNRVAFSQLVDMPKSYITITQNINEENKCLYFVFYFDEPLLRSSKITNINTSISSFELPLKQSRTMLLEEKKLTNKRFRNLLLNYPVITPNNFSGISENTSKRCFITLQRGSLQFFQNIPVYLFYQINLYEQLSLDNIVFDFTNSFIDIVNPVEDDFKSIFFNCLIEA